MKKFDLKKLESELVELREYSSIGFRIYKTRIRVFPTNASLCMWTHTVRGLVSLCDKYNVIFYIDFDEKCFIICIK